MQPLQLFRPASSTELTCSAAFQLLTEEESRCHISLLTQHHMHTFSWPGSELHAALQRTCLR